MPRVNFVKSARKAQPEHGIAVGESYYWWKFNFGPKVVSKTYPKPSQLTRSDFLRQILSIEENFPKAFQTIECLKSEVESVKDEIQGICDEQQEKLDSMPEQLQETSSSGETLQERIDALESMITEIDSIDLDVDDPDLEDLTETCRDALTWQG